MESDQTFIEKTFQIINELTGHISFVTLKVLYISSTREINLSRAINDIHLNGFTLDKNLIFYLDYSKRLFVHIGTFPFPKGFELLLKFQLFLETTIKLRIRKLSNPNSPKNQKKPSLTQKTTRKQKTIKEVQQLVTMWRNYFQMTDLNGKKLYTLQSAAMKLGVQKKTLDDYYYKLKTAESLGFNFEKNKHEKIGLLRKFVKENKQSKNVGGCVSANQSISQCHAPVSMGRNVGFNGGLKDSMGKGQSMEINGQKAPEDDIDKYFARSSESSSQQQSEGSQ